MTQDDFAPFYARVAPMFWPILYWNVRWFLPLLMDMLEKGEEDMIYEVTWYGHIRILSVFRIKPPTRVRGVGRIRGCHVPALPCRFCLTLLYRCHLQSDRCSDADTSPQSHAPCF